MDNSVLDADEDHGHRSENSAQARILRQGADERLGLTQGVGKPRDFIGRQKQQAILLKKFAAARVADGEESFRMCQKRPGEFGRRLLGEFWRRGVDDDDNTKLGERLDVLQRSLCPRQIVRYQLVYVGLDSKVFRRIDAGCCRDSDCGSEDPQWASDTEINDG